jgi:hypothetical protein
MPENRSEKSKKLKTTKADSGAQLFMSEEAKEQMRNRPRKGSEIENLINQHLESRMLEGKITPEKSGRTQEKWQNSRIYLYRHEFSNPRK